MLKALGLHIPTGVGVQSADAEINAAAGLGLIKAYTSRPGTGRKVAIGCSRCVCDPLGAPGVLFLRSFRRAGSAG